MRIVYFNSDLATQIMQYIFLRYREIIIGDTMLIDDTTSSLTQSPYSFEFDKVFPNAKLKFVKDTLEKEVLDDIVSICVDSNGITRLPDIFLSYGIDITIVADSMLQDEYKFDGSTISAHYYQLFRRQLNLVGLSNGAVVTEDTENIFFMGDWCTEEFGMDIRETIQQELKFMPLQDSQAVAYQKDIEDSQHAVGIYVSLVDKSIDDYAKAIRKVRFELIKSNLKPAFFFFSDEPNLDRDKFKFGADDHVVSVQASLADQLQLMTYCDSLIDVKTSPCAVATKIISSKEITLHLF